MTEDEQPHAIGVIVGLDLISCGRVLSMLELGFGELGACTTLLGTMRIAATYQLALQCNWRITLGNQIIVASKDIYYDEFGEDLSDVHQLEKTHTLQDERFRTLFSWKYKHISRNHVTKIAGFSVTGVSVGAFGDLRIEFNTGHRLETFTTDTTSEQWRLFAPGKPGPHLVYPEECDDEL